MPRRTKQEIEKEMEELLPKKELAWIDYQDNSGGDEDTKEHLIQTFREYRDRWNRLVAERKQVIMLAKRK